MRGEKIYEYDLDVTGATDCGVPPDVTLSGRVKIPPQGLRIDAAFDGRGMSSDASQPVYFIALLRAPDVERYRSEYGRKVLPLLTAFGAKVLVGSASPTVLEGNWDATWTVIIEFPDRATAMRWYESEPYAPLKRLRLEELTTGGEAVLFDAYRGPAAIP